ncbi:MAG: hypothetical protein GY828_01165, partial [Candidatus Gracilibacteria bacterium]|nr:hypothetical protein [Candidatus Gracilibacteria bacterium]
LIELLTKGANVGIFILIVKSRKSSLKSSYSSVLIITINIIFTVLMVLAASKIKLNPEITALMPDKSEASELIKKYEPNNQKKNEFFLALEVKDKISVEALQIYNEVINEIDALTEGFSNSIFSEITFKKKGGRLAPIPLSPSKSAPENENQLKDFLSNLETDVFSKKIFYTENGSMFNTIFYSPQISDTNQFTTSYYKIIEKLD